MAKCGPLMLVAIYAIRTAVYIHNTVPVLLDGRSLLELFSGTNVGFRMRDNHAFACPVFALQNSLAAGNTIPKWSPRWRLGLNLGPSPNHAQNVNLILNLNTGLVSPQFHCRYDNFFETTHHSDRDIMTSANWKQLAGFTKYDGNPSVQDRLSSSDQRVMPIGTNPPAGTQDYVEFSQDATPDDDVSLSGDSIATMQASEGDFIAPVENIPDTPAAGISSRGRVRKLSRAMQESVSQQDF